MNRKWNNTTRRNSGGNSARDSNQNREEEPTPTTSYNHATPTTNSNKQQDGRGSLIDKIFRRSSSSSSSSSRRHSRDRDDDYDVTTTRPTTAGANSSSRKKKKGESSSIRQRLMDADFFQTDPKQSSNASGTHRRGETSSTPAEVAKPTDVLGGVPMTEAQIYDDAEDDDDQLYDDNFADSDVIDFVSVMGNSELNIEVADDSDDEDDDDDVIIDLAGATFLFDRYKSRPGGIPEEAEPNSYHDMVQSTDDVIDDDVDTLDDLVDLRACESAFDPRFDNVMTSLDDDVSLSVDDDNDEEEDVLFGEDINEDEPPLPALTKSLFKNVPPTITFPGRGQRVEAPLPEHEKLMKWKMSEMTPIVVRELIKKSNFTPSKTKDDWLGYHGKHMVSEAFRSVRDYQKVNHFPGSFQLGRKDRMWRNLSRLQTKFGKQEFSFIPQTYILPQDKKLLRQVYDEAPGRQKFIIKPPAASKGIGIKVVNKWSQIPQKKSVIVQKYLSHPMLIDGHKFDLRVYVYVSSIDPLRIYVYDNGLVRFATSKYSNSMKTLSNRFMHLTNYSVNKKAEDFVQNDDVNATTGHKWSLLALWSYMDERGMDVGKVKRLINDAVIKTLISTEHYIFSLVKANCRNDYVCHEVYGFDVMLDEKLKPWVLEVNISPSLHSNSLLDAEIKGGMMKDLLNISGIKIPTPQQINPDVNLPQPGQANLPNGKPTFTFDKRKQFQEMSAETRAKHAFFAKNLKKMTRAEMKAFILEHLTANDIQTLTRGEDEINRMGNFDRIFPNTNRKYQRYFDMKRYNNILCHFWEVANEKNKDRGVGKLKQLCAQNKNIVKEDQPATIDWSVYLPDAKQRRAGLGTRFDAPNSTTSLHSNSSRSSSKSRTSRSNKSKPSRSSPNLQRAANSRLQAHKTVQRQMLASPSRIEMQD